MKIRYLTIALLLTSTALFAEGPTRRTLIIKDGKVVSDKSDGNFDVLRLDGELLTGKRAHLGVRLTDLSTELREHYGAPKDSGVLVASVEENSPADKAGIRVGDIIVSADGRDVASPVALRRVLTDKKDGDSVRLEALRGRARQTFVATVVEREGMPSLFASGELGNLGRIFDNPEWKARIETLSDCGTLQARIKDLEARLKDLEKRLQK
ncbi:MAG TPA: PDZ domain-containing protein [Thermoanaerobaculia bacterium]|jgi:membrane-associated protease RseP (regulator of RpoE activity)|nr:PDZ domain-containing protein [Thermoanaerobaculia bacterium]